MSSEPAAWPRNGRCGQWLAPLLALTAVWVLASPPAHAVPVTATWVGTEGEWTSAADWSFSTTVPVGSIPDNTPTETFDVQVDGMGSVEPIVRLDGDATIASLQVAQSARVDIDAGTRLRLDGASGISAPGSILNDGLIRLVDGIAGGARIESSGDMSLSGIGVLNLGESGAATLAFASALVNGTGHTIRGAGAFEYIGSAFHQLLNEGLIEQTGAESLVFGRTLNEGVIRGTGSGGLRFEEYLSNDGIIEIGPGSRLDSPTTSTSGISNSGQIVIQGENAIATIRRINSLGDFQVLDGAVAQIDQISDYSGSGSKLYIRSALVELLAYVRSYAEILLEDGTLDFDRELTIGYSGFLMGTGTIIANGSAAGDDGLILDGTLAPGVEGAGHIDVVGDVELTRSFEIDLQGVSPQNYDRLTSSGTVTIQDTANLKVGDFESFSPEVGDRFDLIAADQITTPDRSVMQLFSLPALDSSDKFFTTRILADAAGESLTLGVAEAISASWSGGSADYASPNWTFNSPPLATDVASNDLASIFDVVIDSEAGTLVSTNDDVSVASLEIGTDNTLALGAGQALILEHFANRPENGQLHVDGTLRLGTAGNHGQLLADGDINLTGNGLVELGDGTGIKIGNAGSENIELTVAPNVTLKGAGSLLEWPVGSYGSLVYGHIDNQGTIEANGASPLILGDGTNTGTMRAIGTGGLEIHAFENDGVMEVLDGSSLTTLEFDEILNRGLLRFEGSGATRGLRVLNRATFEISDGANIEIDSYTHSIGNLIVRDSQATAFLPTSRMIGGSVLLDQGDLTLRSNSQQIEFTEIRLEGSGRLDLGENSGISRTAHFGNDSAIAPGTPNSAGFLEIDGSVDAATSAIFSKLEWDVFGSSPDQYDAVRVTGDALLDSRTSLGLRFDAAYTPVAGDVFDVLEASSITGLSDANFRRHLFPTLDSLGLYILPSLSDDGTTDVLGFELAAPIQARWIGGMGPYGASENWTFDTPPDSTNIPNASDGEIFDVIVDGAPGSPARVDLDQTVTIRRLAIADQDEFSIASQGTLRFEVPLGNERSGGIQNEGLIRIDGGRIESNGELDLVGTGILEFVDTPGSTLEILSAHPLLPGLVIGEDFTVRGEGTMLAPTGILNRGLIDTGGAAHMEIRILPTSGSPTHPPGLYSEGLIRVRSGDELEINALVDSSGEIQVEAGGSLALRGYPFAAPLVNRGRFSTAGSAATEAILNLGQFDVLGGSLSAYTLTNENLVNVVGGVVTTTGLFENRGEFHVDAGSSLQVRSFRQTGASPSTHLGGHLNLGLSGLLALDAGTLSLVDGTIVGSRFARLNIAANARLEGDGSMIIGNSLIPHNISGVVSPGIEGFGAITIGGDVTLTSTSDLEIDIGINGGQTQNDLITVIGTSVLSGTVTLNALDSDDFEIGDAFDLLVSTLITDAGFMLAGPELANGLNWIADIVSGLDDMTLRARVVPEPSAALFVGLGLAALARLRTNGR